jgi:hypothetical protein
MAHYKNGDRRNLLVVCTTNLRRVPESACTHAHDAVIRVYDEMGKLVKKHRRAGEFKSVLPLKLQKNTRFSSRDVPRLWPNEDKYR